MMKRPGYLNEFLKFWTPRPEIKRVWFSLFTPQVGDTIAEILEPQERAQAIADMLELRKRYPKLEMGEGLIRQFASPPKAPEECVFARTTRTLSADLRTEVTPCQFGGHPDCGSCGCIASMGLAAVAAHKLGGIVPLGMIFKTSLKIGQIRRTVRARSSNGEARVSQVGELKEAMIDTVRRSSMVKHSRLPKLSSGACEKEFASLLELSARLGCEPMLVQANNGNTSAKLDGVLWIKASGKCLANAKREHTFVPVELAAIK